MLKEEFWPKKKKKREGFRGDKAEMNMTPMIDVCFQLLVFFMVTSKFKTLEGKLAAYLPKDRGQINIRTTPPEFLPIRVVLRWNPTIQRCKVYVGQVLCNYDDQGISRAFRRVQQVRQTGVNTAEIDSGGDVPMEWVVKTLNMLIKSDMGAIHFTGSFNPLRDNR
ncbi:MAG: biopolymer transporter ExbD [Planctomycetota bacterium]|jgi:biopolymer transport protein ExbD